jgi:amino acid transporter
VLEYAVGAATVSISWSRYLMKFLEHYNLHFPPQLAMSPFDSITTPEGAVIHGIINLPAVVIIVAMSMLLIKGTQESALLNAIVVALKVTVVIIFIFLGWSYINPANHAIYIPENTGTFGEYGWSGIIRAAGIIFFAYIGFDAVSTAAQEAKNPSRDMPIDTTNYLQDEQTQPNYIPKSNVSSDYIRDYEETTEKNIREHEKKKYRESRIDEILSELQTPILICILFFIFQLPIINSIIFKKFSFLSLHNEDGNFNFYGLLFKSMMFGSLFYSVQKVTTFISEF